MEEWGREGNGIGKEERKQGEVEKGKEKQTWTKEESGKKGREKVKGRRKRDEEFE